MGSKSSKSNRQELPSISEPKQQARKISDKISDKNSRMTISVPRAQHRIAELDRIRMDVRPLSSLQRKGLVELTSALIENEFVLENGTVITRQCHAIKWILERFGQFAEK